MELWWAGVIYAVFVLVGELLATAFVNAFHSHAELCSKDTGFRLPSGRLFAIREGEMQSILIRW